MSNRRDFLKSASLAVAGGLLASKASNLSAATTMAAPAPQAHKALGLQVYSLMGEGSDDLNACMKKLQQMGYVNLELAGYAPGGKIGKVDMMDYKKACEDNGLKLISSHVNPVDPKATDPWKARISDFTKENKQQILDFYKSTAADHAKLGCKFLIQPMMPNIANHDQAKQTCEIFNEIADVCKAAGIATGFGYHNHNMEFNRLMTKEQEEQMKKNPMMAFFNKPGDQIYDLMLRDTDPSKVYFEMDVYWTVMGQNAPLDYLTKHKDRIKCLHIKDRAILGASGMVNFEPIFNQMYANGIEHYFVELEKMSDGRTQCEGLQGCADYLLSKSFVK